MQPAYSLRPNKTVDRLTLIDVIRLATNQRKLREYTYYGMGGPTLEDFRLIHQFYPEISMVCVERDKDIQKRQRFHVPCKSSRIKLELMELSSFLAQYDSNDEKSIFWLDYTDLRFSHFSDFMSLLGKVGEGSLIKITLRSRPLDYDKQEKADQFKTNFKTVLPNPSASLPITYAGFAQLLQEMIQVASQQVLPSAMARMFLPICTFYYNDGSGMFTLTGIVCARTEETELKKAFKTWAFANLDWNPPKQINVPSLSTKERLHLQRCLPTGQNAGKVLRRSLGYLIDDDEKQTEMTLQQYADFHQYFPYFVRATP